MGAVLVRVQHELAEELEPRGHHADETQAVTGSDVLVHQTQLRQQHRQKLHVHLSGQAFTIPQRLREIHTDIRMGRGAKHVARMQVDLVLFVDAQPEEITVSLRRDEALGQLQTHVSGRRQAGDLMQQRLQEERARRQVVSVDPQREVFRHRVHQAPQEKQ